MVCLSEAQVRDGEATYIPQDPPDCMLSITLLPASREAPVACRVCRFCVQSILCGLLPQFEYCGPGNFSVLGAWLDSHTWRNVPGATRATVGFRRMNFSPAWSV